MELVGDDSLASGDDTPDPSRPVAVRQGPGVRASSPSSLLNGGLPLSLAAIAVQGVPYFRAVALLPSKNPVTWIPDEWLRDMSVDRAATPRGRSYTTGRQLIHREISLPNLPGRHQAEHTPNSR